MPTQQGSVELLNDPVAQQLLQSTNLAKLAYNWTDGSPRVVPIWFQWNGREIVMGTPTEAPKVKVLDNAKVALTIDSTTWPYKVLIIRGVSTVQIVEGVVPEYASAAERYFGEEGGKDWVKNVKGMVSQMARVVVTPNWVAILDFEKRFPSALEKAMGM